MFRTDVLPTLTVKTVMMLEELRCVFSASLQPTEFWLFPNTHACANKVSMRPVEYARLVQLVVPNVQTPQSAKDVQFQPLTAATDNVCAPKVISSPLNQLDTAKDVTNIV